MIKIIDNQIKRGDTKIGRVEDDHIIDLTGKRICRFTDHEVYDTTGKRVAYVEGEYIHFPVNDMKVRIEENNKLIEGVVSDTCRAAIRLMLL